MTENLTNGADPEEEASVALIILGRLPFPQNSSSDAGLDVRGVLRQRLGCVKIDQSVISF